MHCCIGTSPTPTASRRTFPTRGREGGGAASRGPESFMQSEAFGRAREKHAALLPPLYGEGGERSEPGGVGVLRP